MAAAPLPGLLPPGLLLAFLLAPGAAAETRLRLPAQLEDSSPCSVPGDDCRQTRCCTEPGATCREKNDHWASCRQECRPFSFHEHDPPEHRTRWTCRLLRSSVTTTRAAPGATTAAPPATTTSPARGGDESSLADKDFDREVSIGPDVKLHFMTYASEDIRLAIDVPGTGWAALGVGPSMADADAVIGGGSKGGGEPEALGAFALTGRSGSAVREDAAATDLLFTTEVLHEGGRTKVLFTRPLDNGRTAITLGGVTSLVWAYGAGDRIAYHGSHMAAVHFRFLDGATDAGGAASGPRWESKILHGALMLSGWGVLIPLGTLAAAVGGPRFEAGGRVYFNAHRALQSAGLLAAAAGVVQIVAALYPGGDFPAALREGLLPRHGYIGLAIMLVAATQPLNALCRPSKESDWRALWEGWHKSAGRVLAIAGLANCILGALLAKQQHVPDEVFHFFLVFSALLSGVWVLAYFFNCCRRGSGGGEGAEPENMQTLTTLCMASSHADDSDDADDGANTGSGASNGTNNGNNSGPPGYSLPPLAQSR